MKSGLRLLFANINFCRNKTCFREQTREIGITAIRLPFPVYNKSYCTARQCSPLRRKFMECYIIKPAQSLLMKHLVIGHRQKAPYLSAFHWSPRGCLITIGQHFVTTRVVHLPKRTETSLICESDRFGN